MAQELKIKVESSFQVKLAELVWDSCSQLARDTAAGQLALSLASESESPEIQMMLVNALKMEVMEAVRPQAIETVRAAFMAELKKELIEEIVADGIIESRKTLRKKLSDKMNRVVDKRIDGDVEIAYQEFMGSQNESFAKIILRRIDELVANHLKIQLANNNRAQQHLKNGEFRAMAAEHEAQTRFKEPANDGVGAL